MKKGFTILEVILALILASVAAFYVIQTMAKNNFYESITNLQKTIKIIIEDGIIGENGYASATDVNCSPNYDFVDLNTSRLFYCNDWNTSNSFFLVNDRITSISDINGTRKTAGSQDLLVQYGGCNLQVSVDLLNVDSNTTLVDNPRRFYVYVDCRNDQNYHTHDVNNTEDLKTRTRIEQAVKFTFENELHNIYKQTDDFATGINIDPLTGANVAQGGKDNDARIGAWFEL